MRKSGSCLGWIIALMISAAIGGFCFDYNLAVYFGEDIPWYGDCFAGFFTAPINIPAAVIGFVLECCGMPTPIFNPGN